MENATGVRSSARIDANDEGEDASERFASVGTYNKVTGRVTAEVNELLQRRRAAGPPGGQSNSAQEVWRGPQGCCAAQSAPHHMATLSR